MIIFISSAMGAQRILAEIGALLYIIPALVLFYIAQFSVSLFLARRTGLNHADTIAVTFGVSGKNISLAIGIAAQFFSPLTVLMLAVNPLIQMPSMAMYMRKALASNNHSPAKQ